MSLSTLADLLKTMDAVGINEAVLEPTENGETLIRAANKDRNIIVFDVHPDHIVDMPMGIQSVRGLLSRIMLFDLEKASLDFKDNGTEISDLTIKQGRKKASFRFCDTSHLNVPKRVPSEEPISGITFTKDYVDYLNTAIGAMSYTGTKQIQTVSVSVKDEVVEISVYDGESDSFVDHIDLEHVGDIEKGVWEVQPFKTVLNQSLKLGDGETVELSISPSHKIAIFSVGMVEVMISPMA